MKASRLLLSGAILLMAVFCFDGASAQNRNHNGSHRTTTSNNRTSSRVNGKANVNKQKATSAGTAKDKSQVRVSNNSSARTTKADRKATNNDNNRNKTTGRNSGYNNDNGSKKGRNTGNMNEHRTNSTNRGKNESTHRHDNNGRYNNGSNAIPPSKPDNHGKPNDHGKQPGKPNGHHDYHDRPNGPKPGGHSAPKPGVRPHDHYRHHDYHPPHPYGGHWGPPPPNTHHWSRPLPPPPPSHKPCYHGAPPINVMFGLAFGTFIDYSINSLLYNGYNVLGYANNAIYLSGITQSGYTWDDVQMNFNDGLFSSACFQEWSSSPSQARYNSVYNQLCTLYGPPVSNNSYQGILSHTWWGGNQTGYVSLEFGYGMSDSGHYGYFTTLIYGSNY